MKLKKIYSYEEIRTFKNDGFVDMAVIVDQYRYVWFRLTNVCCELNLNPDKVCSMFGDAWVTKHCVIDSIGEKKCEYFAHESAVCKLALSEAHPKAKKFHVWVDKIILSLTQEKSEEARPSSLCEIENHDSKTNAEPELVAEQKPEIEMANKANLSTLTKNSDENEIKLYFQKVLELKQSGEEFPVNLELVWPLAYERKDHAVRVLTSEFIKSVDYQVFPKNGEMKRGDGKGHRLSDSYKLSVSCMEYFIARKVRPVFEVYRQVFHKVAEADTPELIMARALMVAKETIEQHKIQLELAESAIKEQAPKVEYYDKVLESKGYLTVNMIAAGLGISNIRLNRLLCEWGIQYKQSETYFLYHQHRDKGYTAHRPHPYTDSQGNIKTRQHMYWTEKGKKFIIELYHKKSVA
jgi:phage antirepressor YoqD-like protein/prophage antirepressor-like protein